MYDKERFILKAHYALSKFELFEIGKTLGWTSQEFSDAARNITLERNATVSGRGLPHQPVTDDTNWFTPTYKDTPEWHDASVAQFEELG